MVINPNTTIVDLALNLSGSIAAIPTVLKQLPVGTPIGFDALPEPWDVVDEVGQSWTPALVGLDVNLDVPVLNPTAMAKAPFTTNLATLGGVISSGNADLEALASLIND